MQIEDVVTWKVLFALFFVAVLAAGGLAIFYGEKFFFVVFIGNLVAHLAGRMIDNFMEAIDEDDDDSFDDGAIIK